MPSRLWIALAMLAAGLVAVPMADAAPRKRGPVSEIVTVQVGLRVLGYDPGLIDGLEGPRTVSALAAYATDRGIVLNQATVELVVALLGVEAREQLLSGVRVEENHPLTMGNPRMLPIQGW